MNFLNSIKDQASNFQSRAAEAAKTYIVYNNDEELDSSERSDDYDPEGEEDLTQDQSEDGSDAQEEVKRPAKKK